MAAAGSRHEVMKSCREVNDGLADIPEAKMEIGFTHVYLFFDHSCSQARTCKDGCQESEWCMFLSVSDKREQSEKTRSCCVITNWHTNKCRLACELYLVCWWIRSVCLLVCDKVPPPGPVYSQHSPKALNTVLQASTAHIPIIALSSLFKVSIRRVRLSVCACVMPWACCCMCVNGIIILSCVYSMLPVQSVLSSYISPNPPLLFTCSVCFQMYQSISLRIVSPHQSMNYQLLPFSPLPSHLAAISPLNFHSFISQLLLGCCVCVPACGVVHVSAEWMEPSCQSCQSLCQEMTSGCSEDMQYLSGTVQIRVQARMCVWWSREGMHLSFCLYVCVCVSVEDALKAADVCFRGGLQASLSMYMFLYPYKSAM